MPTEIAKQSLPVWEQARHDSDLTLDLPGGVPMFFRRIPAGRFRMGSRGYSAGEEPVHEVIIAREFYLSTFVVTQEQWRAVAKGSRLLKRRDDPSHDKGPRLPVEIVRWDETTVYCRWLAKWSGLPKGTKQVRRPTEAEWEYACRAGSESEFYNGDGEGALAEAGWYAGNSANRLQAVDERAESHPFGLYGMHGNAYEWCEDVWDGQAYRKRADGWASRAWTIEDAGTDAKKWDKPDGSRTAAARVLRGGAYGDATQYSRSAFRMGGRPEIGLGGCGFRVCLVLGDQEGFAKREVRSGKGRGI